MREGRGPSLEFFILFIGILVVAFCFYVKIDRINRNVWMAPAFVTQGITNARNIQKLGGAVQKLKAELEELKKSEEPKVPDEKEE